MKYALTTAISFIVICLLSVSSFATLNTATAQSSANSTVLNMTLVVPPNTLNGLAPVSGTSSFYILELEFPSPSPLDYANGSSTYANSATTLVSHNSNYTQWIFNMNTNMRWSNGQNLSAQDMLATFGPNFGLLPQYDFWGLGPEISKEYALNNSAAVYDLNVSDAHFADKANAQSYLPVYPASFVNNGGANSSDFGTNVAGGPFYTANYTEGSFQMVMPRNPYYTPLPHISAIHVNFVESISQTVEYLLAGTSDLAPMEPSNVPSILKNPNLGLFDAKGAGGVATLEYNVSVYPYNITEFRQALAYSINMNQFVQQALNGYGIPGNASESLISPLATIWYNSNIKQYNYNPQEAISLLNSIGIQKGSDGFFHYANGSDVSLTIWADTDNTADTVGAGIVQQNLQSLGFKTTLQTTSAANIASDYSTNVDNIQSDMILFTNTIAAGGIPILNTAPAWNSYWLPTVPHPYWEYPPSANSEYESNLSAWTATDNYTLTKQYTYNIESLNAQFLPTIVLAYPDDLWGYNKAGWTGWPQNGPNSYIDVGSPQFLRYQVLANLQPNTGITPNTSTASSSTGFSSTISAIISTSSSNAATSFTSNVATTTGITSGANVGTSSQTSSSLNTSPLFVIGVIVVALIGSGALILARRRSRASN